MSNKYLSDFPDMPKSFQPEYQDNHNFQTNAKSYFHYLAKSNKFLEIMAERIEEYDETLNAGIKEIKETLNKYGNELDEKLTHFDTIVLEQTLLWIDENMEDIFTNAVQMVWFGLTDDGYFMAVIPENWSDVQFDTSAEGQLMLIN